jgi:arylformamidase
MIVTLNHNGNSLHADLTKPLDISIPLRTGKDNVNAWYCDPVRIEPVVMGDWIGDVNKGSGVNFRNVFLNPHGNGTHTECVGHISAESYTLNQNLKTFFFLAELVSVKPEQMNDDLIITRNQLEKISKYKNVSAIIVRTLPNNPDKFTFQYSNTNPAYLHHEAAQWIVDKKISHLLIDLPSIDREKDEGKLRAHHVFWQYPEATRKDCSITELIYVDNSIPDGLYLLNIQITSIENDASPSKPVLYKIEEK